MARKTVSQNELEALILKALPRYDDGMTTVQVQQVLKEKHLVSANLKELNSTIKQLWIQKFVTKDGRGFYNCTS